MLTGLNPAKEHVGGYFLNIKTSLSSWNDQFGNGYEQSGQNVWELETLIVIPVDVQLVSHPLMIGEIRAAPDEVLHRPLDWALPVPVDGLSLLLGTLDVQHEQGQIGKSQSQTHTHTHRREVTPTELEETHTRTSTTTQHTEEDFKTVTIMYLDFFNMNIYLNKAWNKNRLS